MGKMTLAERALEIMRDMNMMKDGKPNGAELARFAGITRGAVNQWLTSKPDANMAIEPSYTIADKSNYEPRWLQTGDGPKFKQKGGPRIDALVSLFEATNEQGKKSIIGVAKTQPVITGERNDLSEKSA